VEAEVVSIGRAKKVVVIKYKAKSNYFKKRGHRQPYFQVKITSLK
jgi:large subunit ribosomal protein L21